MARELGIKAPPIERGTKYTAGQLAAPELPVRAGALSEQMQDIARQYLGARQRSGHALLEAARWLSEARQAAKHGEWGIFLEATNTSDDTAERLLNIHAQAEQNPQFADFVRTQWIGQSAAALLAAPSTPPEVIAQVLSAPEPMKVVEIRNAIKEAKQPAELETAPDFDAAHERAAAVGRVLTKHGAWWRLEYAGYKQPAAPPADVLVEIARLEQTGDGLVSFSAQTTEGPKAIKPQRVLGALALHVSSTSSIRMAISHIVSGRAVAEFAGIRSATMALTQLAALDWSSVRDGHTGPDLRQQIDAILAQYPDARGHAERIAALAAPPAASPDQASAAATRGLRTEHNHFRTDLDLALHARLVERGYHWEHAKQTPDGRWHHVISARNHALLRNDQILMRRERLVALLEAGEPEKEEPEKEEPRTENREPDRTAPSAAYEYQERVDDTALAAARISIQGGAYPAAQLLLNQVKVKTVARDELLAQIPTEYARPAIDPRERAIILWRQLAPILLTLPPPNDQEALSEAIDTLYHAKAGSEARGVVSVIWALLDLEED